ncbi:hypothetical protein [Polluticoccus soli]|uniref:hypothetical protein n=1 Tax=Polluticoccus soli TaxID=3034150 RepID=UPI0023E2F328|nr:hypothetical protein [Flavipsychrobacter sp. JY13-12]
MKKALSLLVLSICLTSTIAVAQTSNLLASYESHLSRLNKWEQEYANDFRYDSLEAINKSLIRLLIQNPGLLNADFSKLNGKGSVVSTSEDKRVRIYSWDDGTGGTMRSANSVIHYKVGSQIKSEELLKDEDTMEYRMVPFYRDLHSVATPTDSFYVVVTHLIGSSGVGSYEIQAFKIVSDTLDWNVKAFETKSKILSSISYEYDVTWGGPNRTADPPVIKIDWPKKTFRIPLIDEKNRITGRHLVYAFNGQRFKYQRVE